MKNKHKRKKYHLHLILPCDLFEDIYSLIIFYFIILCDYILSLYERIELNDKKYKSLNIFIKVKSQHKS
jgi:hypothetical protein